MGLKPDNFMQGFASAMESKKSVSVSAYRKKILAKYFGSILKDVSLIDIWKDDRVEDKLEEVKHRSGDPFINKLFINKYPNLYIYNLYKGISITPLWKEMMSLLKTNEEVGIIFPLKFCGDHIFHNFTRGCEEILKKPRIIYPGNSGKDLYILNLGVFVKENELN